MDSELAEAIQAALKCKRAASLRLVASSCRPATSGKRANCPSERMRTLGAGGALSGRGRIRRRFGTQL